MPKFSYIELACKKLDVDPNSILAFHEYENHLAIITSEGKKFTFSFEELEKSYQHQKIEDPDRIKERIEPEKQSNESQRPENSTTKPLRPSRNTKTKPKIDPEEK